MIERIKELMEAKQLSSTQFADGINVPRAIVSHVLSGRNKPSLDVVVKILESYRDVRMEWLILGEGGMLKTLAGNLEQNSDEVKTPVAPPGPAPQVEVKEPVKEKIQSVRPSDEAVAPAKPPVKAPARAIERIIIFYDDKTFDTYSPV